MGVLLEEMKDQLRYRTTWRKSFYVISELKMIWWHIINQSYKASLSLLRMLKELSPQLLTAKPDRFFHSQGKKTPISFSLQVRKILTLPWTAAPTESGQRRWVKNFAVLLFDSLHNVHILLQIEKEKNETEMKERERGSISNYGHSGKWLCPTWLTISLERDQALRNLISVAEHMLPMI